MLPTSAGVEPATFWSPVGWRIQLSHRGRLRQKLTTVLLVSTEKQEKNISLISLLSVAMVLFEYNQYNPDDTVL